MELNQLGRDQQSRVVSASGYVEAAADCLVRDALKDRESLEKERDQLLARLDLANRRLDSAFWTPSRGEDSKLFGRREKPIDPGRPWVSSASDVSQIKGRLSRAVQSEEELLKLVGDVRQEKEARTEAALDFYARRTDELLSPAT